MKTLLITSLLIFGTFACQNKQSPININSIASETQVTETIFKPIAYYPAIHDSSKFIADLRQISGLITIESPASRVTGKILAYKKVKLYGSENEYYFIEYVQQVSPTESIPCKYQLLLSPKGKLLKTFSGHRYEFVEISKNQNPFLMLVLITSKGNGGHELYKITADSLENVYEGYYDCRVQTYDAHQDYKIFEPSELTMKVNDFNNDGINDISFKGTTVFIQGQTKNGNWFDKETINGKEVIYSIDNPFKKSPVEYIFIYDKQTGHFKALENQR